MSQTETETEVNPLQKKLSPSQFNASVHFYEADHQLDETERSEVAKDLQNVVTWTSSCGYSAGMAGFITPTLYRRYIQRVAAPAGSFIYKPFMSFLIGLSTMIVAHQGVGKIKFDQQISQLEQQLSKVKQLNVWKTMDYHQAGLFYLYYRQSSMDASYILKDPRSYTEHEVVYHPKTQHDEGENIGSLWDKLRKENGFEESKSSPVKADESKKLGSAWDKVRDSTK